MSWHFPNGRKEEEETPYNWKLSLGLLLMLTGSLFIHPGLCIMFGGALVFLSGTHEMLQNNNELLDKVLKEFGPSADTKEDEKNDKND